MRLAWRTAWTAVKTRPIGIILVWNIPLFLVVLSYWHARAKLLFLELTGLRILLWNEKTERAIQMTLWVDDHPWILLVGALLLNFVYLVGPSTKMTRRVKLGFLAAVTAVALWSCEQFSYLGGKLITGGEEVPAETSSGAKPRADEHDPPKNPSLSTNNESRSGDGTASGRGNE